MKVAQFVHSGHGYFGVCAGAFLAGAEAYSGAEPSYKMLGAKLGYLPGQGEAKVISCK